MSWNDESKAFDNDGSCSFQSIWEVVPCADCDQYNQINTTVGVCRCKHLSRFGIVYAKSNVANSKYGNTPGIYSDFYAMKYWNESFGFYASLAGLCCFIVGHVFIWFIDGRLRHNLIVRLREKVRRFELQYGAMMHRKDGLFYRQEHSRRGKTGRIASKKKVYLKRNQDDVVGLMNDNDKSSAKIQTMPNEEYKEEELEGKRKRKVVVNKEFQEDQQLHTISEYEDEGPINEEDAYIDFRKKGKRRVRRPKELLRMGGRDFDENDRIIMRKLEEEKNRRAMKKYQY